MQNSRSILITGCSSGIGLCAAQMLRDRHYRVFATARKSEDVLKLAHQGFDALLLDLSDSKSIHQAVSQLLEKTGGTIDALFNNGAYGQPGAVEDLTREVLREQFETNLFGTHELTSLILPVMRKQGYGRIIQNSSVLGFAAMRYRGAYNASKYALEGLTDTLRLELAGSGIYISLIEPGPIESRFRENAYGLFQKNIITDKSPHRSMYELMEQRLRKVGPAVPFTLGPESVVARVIHALESKRPKERYYVTFPTYLFACLKRILPTRILDWVLGKVG